MKYITKIMIVTLIMLLTACSDIAEREPEIYLLPDNYTGSFYIIYNVKKGATSRYENDHRVFQIPERGILLTTADTNEGWLEDSKIRYFYLKSDGSRLPISQRWTTSLHDTPKNRQDDRITIFGSGLGFFEPVSGCQVYPQGFIVGTKSDVLDDKLYFDIYGPRGINKSDKLILKDMCEQ